MYSHTEHRRQAGLASLEFTMILPILIVVFFVAVAIVKVGHLRLDVQTSARNRAFESAMNLRVPFLLELEDHETHYLRGTSMAHPPAFSRAGDDFHSRAATTHGRFAALHRAEITPTTRAASAGFVAHRALGWDFDIREQYAVVAVPLWERRQIPLGYDQYLRDRLETHRVVVRIPGLGAFKKVGVDFGDLYSGHASDAVPRVFPKVN